MRLRNYLTLIMVLLTLVVPTSSAHADGVVTICDEAHLLAALAGGGMVTFACSGTITLSAEIVISADTTIDGSGQDVTISGNDAVRVFNVNPGMMFNLNALTVAHGFAATSEGGGIRSWDGTITVNDCVFSENVADAGGAIYSALGNVEVNNSAFSNNSASASGGGIYSYGKLRVSHSTFSDNDAQYGGGMANDFGNATVDSSTFAGNSADFGGGIWSYGVLLVGNSTFSGNSAAFQGGGVNNNGVTTVSNSTFSGNSTGVSNTAGTVTLRNTIVTHSQPGNNCDGAIIDGGRNLSYPDTTCPGINRNPRLYPLQNNGGPTATMALGPGSAALDAGDDATCAAAPINNLDQRGVLRPQGAHCDIGAVEQQPYLERWFPIVLVHRG